MKKHYIVILFIVITINFFLPRLMPGDPFLFLSVEDGNVSITFSQEQIDYYKAYYGLNKPLHIQFFAYIKRLMIGDLGKSIYYNQRVSRLIFSRLPWTFFIVFSSLSISTIIGGLIGAVSAWKRNGWFDKVMYFVMGILSEIPSFMIGLGLLFIMAANLKWFPLSGAITPFKAYDSNLSFITDVIYHGALPILALVLTQVGDFYLVSRNSMMTVLSKAYMTTAKAKGLKNHTIIVKHALRNAWLPVLARFFLSLSRVIGGAVLVENVFAYPGVGKLMREAVTVRDYVLIQGIFLIVVLTVIVVNIFADWIYKKLDPRVEH